jgi:hypothetical protein
MVNTTVDSVQTHVCQLVRTVERDLSARGLLMIDRAQSLLSAVKQAMLTMRLVEETTPSSFFDAKWREQAKTLHNCETRLQRIITNTELAPPCNHRT